MNEKAYKLLALQQRISNRSAKELIDMGVVYASGKKVLMARALMPADTKFKVQEILKIETIFEDDNLVVVDKPAFITSEQVEKKKKSRLLHRLDKETSGVLLLTKDEDFRLKAINSFKNQEVIKEYIAWVNGMIVEPVVVDDPLLTIKKGTRSYTKVSQDGKEAITEIYPLLVEGKKSKIKVIIKTGRTHQIRAHLKSIGHSILGDTQYGGKTAKRIFLHSSKISLLGYTFEAQEPEGFDKF